MGEGRIELKPVDSGPSTNFSMLAVAILAAGKGTRMNSALPKVLQKIAGNSLVERVLASCSDLKPDQYFLIVGHQAELVREKLVNIPKLEFVLQEPQNGTGHAVQQLIGVLKGFEGELLVLNGDVPLLQPKTIQKLVDEHRSSQAGVTFLSARLSEPKGYGRVFADSQGKVEAIIEDRDCTDSQLLNNLTNAGIYCFNWKKLIKILPRLSNKNQQGEIYLTDAVAMFDKAMHIEVDDPNEVSGINDRIQMAQCEALLQRQLQNYWMKRGVTFIDPKSCTLSQECNFGSDVIVQPQTHFQGNCLIGDGCHIGPGTLINNSKLGNNVKVLYSVIHNSKIGNEVLIGPFAHLRPESKVAKNCKVGNFVEIKKSTIGENSKINHLSYLGDAEVGCDVNIGAGTITANFDGERKHQTTIGNGCKTGANSVLVAPIILGSNVTIGAGSTLTKNIPSNSLAIGRARQFIKEEWFDPDRDQN